MLQVNSGDRHLSKSPDISAGSAQKQGKRGDYLDSTGVIEVWPSNTSRIRCKNYFALLFTVLVGDSREQQSRL